MFEFGEKTLEIDDIDNRWRCIDECSEKNKVILRRGEEICTLRKDIDEMNDVIRDSREDNEMLSDMCDELQDENDGYIEGFFTMKKEIRELEAKNKQLSLTLDEVECENEILFNEKDEVEFRLRECETKLFFIDGENRSLECERNTLDSALECLEDECNRLCNENHSLYTNYECSKLRVEEYRSRIFELSAEAQSMANDRCNMPETRGCQSKYGDFMECFKCNFRRSSSECDEYRRKNRCEMVQ